MVKCLSVFCLVGSLSWLACSNSGPVDPVAMDGSSTLFPLSEAIAQDYMKANRGTEVKVTFSGTPIGFQRLCGGSLDVANASRPITPQERAQCEANKVEFVELPVGYDGLTIIVHPRNDWATAVTTQELRTLWEPAAERKVVKWNQVRPDWPDREIHLFGPGTESGTFDYFTGVIVGKVDASRKDYTSSGDDQQIVERVAADELALGFVGFGHFERNHKRLKALAVDDLDDTIGKGPVEPSLKNIGRGVYRPLSRPVFIYAALKALERPAVKTFVEFYLRHAGDRAAQMGVVPLTLQTYELTQQRLARRVIGTMYESASAADTTIELLLSR